MRIRKEIEKWNWRTFVKLFALFFVVYNLFIWLGSVLDQGVYYDGSQAAFWIVNGVLLPLILGLTLSYTFRGASLFINDYDQVLSFKEKLHWHITKVGFVDKQLEPEEWLFRPRAMYYSLLKSWFGTEDLSVTVHDEIVIKGPLRKIASLEDILNSNKDFALNPSTTPQ